MIASWSKLPEDLAISLRSKELALRGTNKRTIGDAFRSPRPGENRILDEINKRMMRMYEAAVTTGMTADFPISITSANAEILVSLLATRSRMRRLERDDPYYFGAIKSYMTDVGGADPFRLEMKAGSKDSKGKFTPDKKANEAVEDAWKEAGEKQNCCTTREMTRDEMYWQSIASMITAGGILFRHHGLYPKNKFGYAIEPIEIDRLDHYWNRPAVGTANEIQFSIEMDEWHAPIAYWILSRHPGDVYAWSNSPKYRVRVPAEEIITLFDIRTRPGQYVVMPRGASVSNRLHRIDQFDIAHCTAAIWSACKPVFFTQEMPTAMEYVPDAIKKTMEYTQEMIEGQGGFGYGGGQGAMTENLQPGETRTLPYGWKVHQTDPKFPIEAAEGFKKDQLRAAGAGLGVPYHRLAGDLTGVNFSSGRLGENFWHDSCRIDQKHIIGNLCHYHFRAWLQSAILSGAIPGIGIERYGELCSAANFFGRRWQQINPLQDTQADILRKEAGLTTASRIVADSEQGGDYDEVCAENESDKDLEKLHGLDFSDKDATLPTTKKGEPNQTEPAPGAQAPAKTGGKQTIKCVECGTVRHNGEAVCLGCGGDGIQIGDLTYARRH